MTKNTEKDFFQIVLEAQKRSCEIAFETAVRTGTALVVNQGGKIVEIKPKFKYILVPIDEKKQKKQKKLRSE